MRKNILHIASRKNDPHFWSTLFRGALAEIGDLTLVEDGMQLSDEARAELIRRHSVLLTWWGSSPVPACLARDRGRLEYICHITGTLRPLVPQEVIESGLLVTNWGDAPAHSVAEGAMALLLAVLKDLHHHIQAKRRGEWGIDRATHGGSLDGLDVGIYGMGVIARRFVEMIRPFNPVLRVYDPYVTDMPEGCLRVESLDELFRRSRAIVIHAGLTDETRGSVTAERLALLPRYGIVINTARGGIVDEKALFAELTSGRLRAGLDVLDRDYLEPGDPARTWENCIFTAHQIGMGWPRVDPEPVRLNRMQEVCLDNLRRFARGEAVRFVMDRDRYLRST